MCDKANPGAMEGGVLVQKGLFVVFATLVFLVTLLIAVYLVVSL